MSWLADVPTCVLKGTISIKEDDPYGNPRVTWDLKNKIWDKFGNVDIVGGGNYKGLKLVYTRKDINFDGLKIVGNFYVESGDTFKFEVRPSSIYENTQMSKLFSWSKKPTKTSCSLDSLGKLKVNTLSNTADEGVIQCQVESYATTGYAVDKVSKTIEIWNRPAQVGDLVYYDGTFSSAESYDGEKTVIGRCFYVAPRNADGTINEDLANKNDMWNRMMVSCEDVLIGGSGSMNWGAFPMSSDEAYQDQYSLFYNDGTTRKNLTIDGIPSVYDINSITNITSTGMKKENADGVLEDYYYVTDESFIDTSTAEGVANNNFKVFPQNTAMGDGFGAAIGTGNDSRKLDEDLARLAGSGYAKDSLVNSAYIKTLKVIQHRNAIIAHVEGSSDRSINNLKGLPLIYPTASDGMTELDSLADAMEKMRTWATNAGYQYPNKWTQLLYPAASACYAFEPKVAKGEVLADKFKAHNWALPTEGHLARMFWYIYRKEGDGVVQKDNSVLGDVRSGNKVVFNRLSSSNFWSVTESSSRYSWLVSFGSGHTLNLNKYFSYRGRAVSAF